MEPSAEELSTGSLRETRGLLDLGRQPGGLGTGMFAQDLDDDENAMQGRGKVWRSKHRQVRADPGMPQDYKPWSEKGRRFGGIPPRSQRMKDLVEIAWGSRRPKLRFLPFYADLSQCGSRKVRGAEINTVATSARIFDFKKRRCLRTDEILVLQGYPAKLLKFPMHIKPSQMQTAAGQGMFLPSIGKYMLALFLIEEAPWWR